jgi:hypothetical protein
MENANVETKKIHKWFWPWEDEREEAWLSQMAKQGWHLVKPDLLGQYTFAAGEAKDVVYPLDFISDNKKDESYLQLFKDAGWEHVGILGGWQYFRKQVNPGENTEIFTDNDSKIAKYQRVLLYLVIFLPIWTSVFLTSVYPSTSPVRIGISMLMTLLVLVYIFIAVGILWRIHQLKKSKTL